MGIEIERKFLLKDDSWRSAVSASTVFKQRYLPFLPGRNIFPAASALPETARS